MIKGLYISKAGMLPRQRQLDIVANNLANMNTVGYKKDQVFIRHLLDSVQAVTNENEMVLTRDEAQTDFSPGSLFETGNPLDLAIVGEGFFVIQTPEQNLYTRNGNFTLDGRGRLVTADGYPVMGSGGEIQLAGGDISFGEDGSLMVNGQAVDKIRVVRFEDPSQLTKIGGTYFTEERMGMAEDINPDKLQLRQGYLEGSNVTGIEEMVKMIELYRQFQMAQKAVTTQDQTLEKLINDGGRLR